MYWVGGFRELSSCLVRSGHTTYTPRLPDHEGWFFSVVGTQDGGGERGGVSVPLCPARATALHVTSLHKLPSILTCKPTTVRRSKTKRPVAAYVCGTTAQWAIKGAGSSTHNRYDPKHICIGRLCR